MSAGSKGMLFQIEPAADSDWPWIVQGLVEIAWFRLNEERRRDVSRQTIHNRVEQQVAEIQEQEDFPSQAFVARTEDRQAVGFVWVAKTHNESTGQPEASLLNQYVAEPYRGQGLGRRLMETAEEWARQQGLPRICLSVGAHNTLGQHLYETLGYRVDTLRMTKELDTQEPNLLWTND